VTLAHVNTSMQLASRASDHAGKASSVTDTVDAWVGSEANDRWHGKRWCPRNVSAAYRLACMSSVWRLLNSYETETEMK